MRQQQRERRDDEAKIALLTTRPTAKRASDID
jgi:hypothetical protein